MTTNGGEKKRLDRFAPVVKCRKISLVFHELANKSFLIKLEILHSSAIRFVPDYPSRHIKSFSVPSNSPPCPDLLLSTEKLTERAERGILFRGRGREEGDDGAKPAVLGWWWSSVVVLVVLKPRFNFLMFHSGIYCRHCSRHALRVEFSVGQPLA